MTDYDATAHISEEVRRAAYAGTLPHLLSTYHTPHTHITSPAPSAIFIAGLSSHNPIHPFLTPLSSNRNRSLRMAPQHRPHPLLRPSFRPPRSLRLRLPHNPHPPSRQSPLPPPMELRMHHRVRGRTNSVTSSVEDCFCVLEG